MQQRGKKQIFLDDVSREAESGPVQAHVKVAVSVEVIGTQEDVQVTDGVDHHEEDEEDGGSGGEELCILSYLF